MANSHPKIPQDIFDELSPRARKFFVELIDGYERTSAELLKRIEVLEAQVASIEILEAQLAKLTPQNSSIPPSTQHPHDKPKPKLPAGTKPKKQGAQPGHKRNVRALVPTENCTKVLELRSKQCRRCHAALTGSDPQPLRHQVFELPEIHPIITEYQCHSLTCTCVLVSDALTKPYQQLQQELSKQKQLCVDESPTKQHNSKAWLWVAVAPMFAVFGIFLNRKRESLKKLIGDYSEVILNCDRAKKY